MGEPIANHKSTLVQGLAIKLERSTALGLWRKRASLARMWLYRGSVKAGSAGQCTHSEFGAADRHRGLSTSPHLLLNLVAPYAVHVLRHLRIAGVKIPFRRRGLSQFGQANLRLPHIVHPLGKRRRGGITFNSFLLKYLYPLPELIHVDGLTECSEKFRVGRQSRRIHVFNLDIVGHCRNIDVMEKVLAYRLTLNRLKQVGIVHFSQGHGIRSEFLLLGSVQG